MPLVVAAPGVLGNDVNPTSGGTPYAGLSASLSRQPLNGEVRLQADGSFTYRPFAEFFGIDSFEYVASNGGSAITSYTVKSSPGSISASGSTSPMTVTGLTNGISYTFTATATNGGKWYDNTHIAVNSVGDFMVGYSQFASGQHPGEVTLEQGVHGGAAGPDRVGVADAHRAVAVVQPDRHQLEPGDGAVRAVRKDGRQRDEVVVGLNVVNLHGPILSGARQEVVVAI